MVFTSKIEGKIHTNGGYHTIWSKIFTRLQPHSECVWSQLRKRPPQLFVPPETHNSGAGPVIILLYLQCTNYTVVWDQIANKSSLFVLLNASILRKYRGLQVFSNLSNCNYRIFVRDILLEIGFIEIGFISSNWPATRPHYLLNSGSQKIRPGTIKLAYSYTSTTKRHKGNPVCSTIN